MNRDEIALGASHLRCFPLPGTVLMPGAPLPLHVFEPRYRALVADALAGDRLLAVPQIAEGQEHAHLDRPRLLPYVAVGRVAMHEELPDGRYNIVVEPVARARLGDELIGDEPYRRFTAELLVDTDNDRGPLARVGQRVLRLLVAIPAFAKAPERVRKALVTMNPEFLPLAVAPMVLRETAERQAYIAENSALARAQMLEQALLTRLAEGRGVVAEA